MSMCFVSAQLNIYPKQKLELKIARNLIIIEELLLQLISVICFHIREKIDSLTLDKLGMDARELNSI